MNAESDTSAPAAHQQVLHKAMQVHRDGHHDAARLLYQQVLEVDPTQADALHLMGVLEAELGDYERAALLIGDAAEFVDPVTGEGIFMALRSAELAADAIAPAIAALVARSSLANVYWMNAIIYALLLAITLPLLRTPKHH